MWDVGKRYFDRMNQNLGIIDAAKEDSYANLRTDLNSQLNRVRNLTNSYGTLDARSQNLWNLYNKERRKTGIQYDAMKLSQNNKLADALWKWDEKRWAGEGDRDLADRKDLDAYYTAKGADDQNIAKNMMELGKNINQSHLNTVLGNAVNTSTDYQVNDDGTVTYKGKIYDLNDEQQKLTLFKIFSNDQSNAGLENDGTNDTRTNNPNVYHQFSFENNQPNTGGLGGPGGQQGGIFTTNLEGGTREFSGDHQPGSVGHFQEWVSIFKDQSGTTLSLSGAPKSGYFGDDPNWKGVDNNPGGSDSNTKQVGTYYGNEYYNWMNTKGLLPAGFDGTLIGANDSGEKRTMKINTTTNPQYNIKANTEFLPGGEGFQPNQQQIQAWLNANKGKTIEDFNKQFNIKEMGGYTNKRPKYILGAAAGLLGGALGAAGGVAAEGLKESKKSMEQGGNARSWAPDDPTFKTWFAKNARRPDVMRASNNIEQLKQIFLKEVDMPELPLFTSEIDASGRIDKSGRSLGLSSHILGGLENTDQYRGGSHVNKYNYEEGATVDNNDEDRVRWKDLTKDERKLRFKETSKDVLDFLGPIIGGAGIGAYAGSKAPYPSSGIGGILGGFSGLMLPELVRNIKGLRDFRKEGKQGFDPTSNVNTAIEKATDTSTDQYFAGGLASQGRFGDTELAHVNPQEKAMLESMGGSGGINPNTGLREYFWPALINMLGPMLGGMGAAGAAGGAAGAAGGGGMLSGILGGGGGGGLMSLLSGSGGGGGGGLMNLIKGSNMLGGLNKPKEDEDENARYGGGIQNNMFKNMR